MIGRAEIVNVQAGTGRSFSCGVNCPCGNYFGHAQLSPGSYLGPVGDTGNPFNPQYTTQDCQGTTYGPFLTTANSWSSSDSTVMSITNTGQTSCLKAGTTSITAQETGWTYSGTSCTYTTFPANGSGTGTVDPTVSITGSLGVPLNASSGYTVNIGTNPTGVVVTLKISTTTGSGDATFSGGSHTTTLTGSATVNVNGVTTSSTANNLLLQALDPNNRVLASVTFSTVSVSLTLRGSPSQEVSSDDMPPQPFFTTFLGPDASIFCSAVYEVQGVVTPSNYSGKIILRRTLLAFKTYKNSSLTSSMGTGDDTSSAIYRDDSPEPLGNVYDLDAPGFTTALQDGLSHRYRANFQEYAVLDSAANATAASAAISFYGRVSCISPVSSQWFTLDNSIAGDNTTALGATSLTWNLK